mmetsp:Transcript_39917/g.100275  ORF Transcript_39917/g.100275 Transcript_39917/m.100275 type:complete len:592 (+) Transcript_39917:103-1878(+)
MAPTAKVPWAERHRPKHLGEVIGNTDQVRKLAEWLRDWDDVVLRGKVKEQPAPDPNRKFQPAPENINARAALVSGPPGIGKTTTCTLVARCNPKYRLMEYNASDARSKKIVDQMSNSLSGNHTLKLNAKGGSCIERAVIIMDECDGMAGGDAGGMQALMNMIKNTKNPIICICNERGDQQVRQLSQVCYDIKFKRPENAAVAKRIKHVMEGEGKKVDLHTIEAVVEACGHDIRHIINQTQFFGSVSSHGKETQKDTQNMLNPFDACERLFKSRGSKLPPLDKRLDMFYLDAEMMPLMVQENYLRPFEKRRRGGEDETSLAARASELIAIGDMMSGSWEVQSSSAIMSSIYPAFLTADESFTRPAFPIWLQKKAPAAKAERLVSEMHSKLRAITTTTSKEFATTSYHDLLYKRLVKPLTYGAAKECAAAMFPLNLTREFFTEQASALRAPLHLDETYKQVEGKVRTQLQMELQALKEAAAPAVKKRVIENQGGSAKKKRKGEEEDDEEVVMDSVGAKLAGQRRAPPPKKKAKAGGTSGVGSLASWKPKKATDSTQDAGEKKALMIMKYLDGHTNAVRRRVHMKDILEPWVLF